MAHWSMSNNGLAKRPQPRGLVDGQEVAKHTMTTIDSTRVYKKELFLRLCAYRFVRGLGRSSHSQKRSVQRPRRLLVNSFISREKKRRKNTSKIARKKITVSCRYRTMRGEKPSISHLLNGRQSKKLRCNLKTKMKNPQPKKNVADAFWYVIHSKLPILPNIKMNSILNVETDMQRTTRLDHSQLMQEKLPNEQKVCCPHSITVSGLPSSVSNGKEWGGEWESLPASENSKGLMFNTYQKGNHELVKTDEELKQQRSINIQFKLQIHFPQTILDPASCPLFDQFQVGNPERCARFSPPKSGEAKTDEILSAKECVVPSEANHQREQTAGIENKKTVTFGCCMSAFSTSKGKRNFEQYSDMKTLLKPKCGIFKAKKPPISYIFNIKGDASRKQRKALGCNLTTKMKEVDQGKNIADKMYSSLTINMHSKIEREKDMLEGERLSSEQLKQVISLHEGNITSDDTEEASLQGEEERESGQEALLKVVLEHGRCFITCSGQREELDLRNSENEGSGEILFVTEQDIPQRRQPIDPMQVEEPKKSHQTHNGTIYTAKSKLPLIKSKESLRGQVFIDTIEGGIPSKGSHAGGLYSHGKEEKLEFNKNQQAIVLESLAVSTPDPSESKRQRKTFTCTALKRKMSSKCVIMKARKILLSRIFNIPRNGFLKNLPAKTLKSRLTDFLVHMEYSEALKDLPAEGKEGLAQESPAMMLESLDVSPCALLTSKRKHLKRSGNRNKMSPKCVTLKAKNVLISQRFPITKHGKPHHRKQFKCNFKGLTGKSIPMADIILNDMNVNNRIKVETDEPWNVRFSHELQQQEQSPDGERAWCANFSDKRGSTSNSLKKAKTQGGEAAPCNGQLFGFNAPTMKESQFVCPDLELMNSARTKTPESLSTAQELQQQIPLTEHALYYITHSILNLLPFKKLPKRTETQAGLKDTRSPKILSPLPGKSIDESIMDTAQTCIPFEESPRKELTRSILERDIRLQKDLPVRTPEFPYISMQASSDFKGQRNAAQITKSRTGKAQMVLKTVNITRSDALSHEKQQDRILKNMSKQIPLGRSHMLINTFLSSTLVSPAIKRHKKEKLKQSPLRKKSSIARCWEQGEGKPDKGKRLWTYSCNRWITFKYILESIWQNEKNKGDNEILSRAGQPFLNRMEYTRKDRSILIAEQEAQQKTLLLENISETVCSQTLTVTEHGNLYSTKGQYNSKSTIKDMQQNESIANAFSSPIPLPTNSKIDIEMYSTQKAETDQQRVKSSCYREAQKANSIETQNRPSYTMEMNVQQNKEEVGVETLNLIFPKHQEKKMEGSKDEPGELLTQSSSSLLCLPLLKLDKEMQRISNAGETVHIEPISEDVMKNVQKKKQHMSQKEEKDREKTAAVIGMTHTADVSVKSKDSSPSCTFHRTELHVNIGSQEQKMHEGQSKSSCTVLRKVHVSKPPTNPKLDKGTQGDGELGIKKNPLFPQVISALSDAGEIEDSETIGGDVRKRKHLSRKEQDREQNRLKFYQELLEITGFSPSQLQLPESLGARNNKYDDSNEGIDSCNTIIKANQHMPCTDARDRVKLEGKGRIFPKIISLRIQTSALTYLLSRKRLLLNIKEQVKDAQKDKGKPEMVRKARASLPSPSHLKRNTRINEKKDTLGTIQPCFPPLKIQPSSYSGEKAYTKSLEGYMLKKEGRLKTDIEDKICPMYMDLKAKKIPLCTYSYNKQIISKNILESKWQNENSKEDNEILSKAGLPFLNSMGHRQDQSMLIAEQKAQQQTLVSENIPESVYSPMMIPLQIEMLQKNMSPQKYVLHRIGETISCAKSGEAMFDYLLIDETEYNMASDGSPTRKLGVHSAGSLQSKEEKEDIEVQKVIKYRVDQNIPPTKSGNSLLGDPCDESPRRKVAGHTAKKCEELQRNLLTRSTTSVSSECKRQKEIFEFPEGKILTSPISITMKAQKPPCSQTLTVTEHGNSTKEQQDNSKSTIKDMQQNESMAKAFSSPIPLPTNSKIDIEMYSTQKAETDQQRVTFQNSVYLKLEKSSCYREAQKANSIETQNRPSYTMEMNVQQNKEEVGVETLNLIFPKHQEKKMEGSKDEPGELLTQSSSSLLCLPLLKLDKEMQRISNAGETVHIEPISEDIMKNVQKKKQHMSQKEEKDREKTAAVRGMTHTADISVTSKDSSPSCTFHRTELHVNIGSQEQKMHEGQSKSSCTVLRKVHVSKPPTDPKLDKGTQVDEGELGIKRPPLLPQMISALSDAGEIEDTETIGGDLRKRKHLSRKEQDREQNRLKFYHELLEITGFSPSQLQLPESSGARNNKYANSNEGISSCNTIIKGNQHMSYTDTMEGKGRLLPDIMTLRIQTSPLTHLFSRKRQPLNIKEKGRDVQKDKGKPEMVLRKARASSSSPFHLKWDTRMSEKEDTLGTIQYCLPPLKIQHPPYSGKKAHTKSFESYMLNKKDRLKTDIEDKMSPKYMNLKAKKLPLAHIRNTRELQCTVKKKEKKVQEDKNKLVTNIKDICTSLVTQPYLKFEATEGEEYIIIIAKEPLPQRQSKESSVAAELAHADTIDGEFSTDVKGLKELLLQKEVKNREKTMGMNSIVEPIDMHLNTNKSPVLLIYNLCDLQKRTKEQEGKAQKAEPAGVMLTKTCASSSSPVQLNLNIRIREKSMSALTRSSVSPVHFQESSDSEKVVYVEPIIPNILISPQEEKQCMPQNEEEAGVGTINLMFPIHQEKKMQESKGYAFNKPKEVALRNENDSGILIRSLSISGMNLSQTEEMIQFETNLERKERNCVPKFQKESPKASEIVKRDNSNTVKEGGQNFANIIPEDSQPSMEDQQQMQNLPSVKSEENLIREVNKITVTPEAEEGVVPGHEISRIIKEPDLLTTEQEEKAPAPTLPPTEHPSMSEDPKESEETHMKSTLSVNISPPGVEEPQPERRDQSEPIEDTTVQKVEQQKTLSETLPTPPQVKSNEIKIVADGTSEESLLPLYDAIKNVFESQIKKLIQDIVYADELKEVKAYYPDDCKSPPVVGGPDTTSTTMHPKSQPKPILESKALEIKLNPIPKTAKQCFQKFDFYSKRTVSEDNTQTLYPTHKKMSFLSLEGIDTIKLNLKHKYQKYSPQISCMKILAVNVSSSGSKEIITKVQSVSKLGSGTSSVTSTNKVPHSQILQNYSVEQKDKLLRHFSMKTLEIQMKALSRIVTESYSMADPQGRKKPLSKCLHSGVNVPKPKNIISLGFEEKSLHQIELDLQSKYLGFLLGLPVQSMIQKPSALCPKHILKFDTVAMCKEVDNRGESGQSSVDTELLEQHISFKKQSPHENSSLIRRFPEPTHAGASDPEPRETAQQDKMVLSALKHHVTPEKDQHHVWFQEANTPESFDLKTQENALGLADYHSIQTSQDFTDNQTDVKNSANLEECSALEKHEIEESIILEANPYLSQESENILFELQKDIPLENLYEMKLIQTDLKPLYSDNLGSDHVRGCRKPSCESHNSRKYRSSPKVQPPDWLYHSSLNTVEVPFASDIKFSEEKLLWITENRTRDCLAPLTESNLKLHLAKRQDKPHRHPERKRANFNLYKNDIHWDCYPNYTQRKAKRTREKKLRDAESERANYFLSKHKSVSKPYQEDFDFHYERRQNQPFFYACVPADSLEIIPQTIRWTIPQKTLRKRNFRIPLVAKISSSFHKWNFSKKLGGRY